MKRVAITLIIILSFVLPSKAQEKQEKLKTLEEMEQKEGVPAAIDTLMTIEQDTLAAGDQETVIEDEEVYNDEEVYDEDKSTVTVGGVTVEESDDETVIRIGKKGIRISEDDNDTSVTFEEYDDNTKSSFRGHLGGLELGFCGYFTEPFSTSLEPSENYMNLNTAKSMNFNILLPNLNLGFSRHFGLAATVGLSWSDYHFDGDNSIAEDENGNIIPVYPPEDISFEKSKLSTTYATMPILLEGQIPVSHNRTINIGAGFIGAIKLHSHTKVVYYDNDKMKIKNKDDFSLNLLRYGVTARLGYEMFQAYGTYYLSKMFEDGKGPELFPFEIGIALTFNN
jgi:hypothetical protein